jgi:uncharacterized membrane protein
VRFSSAICVIVTLAVFAAGNLCGQSANFFNQRDDQYRLLGLKRAKEAYEVARQDYERQHELFSRQLISSTELEQARRVFSDAEVNYQQSLLAVLFEKQYISVSKALKYQASDGRKHVRLTLANTSGGTEEFAQLVGVEDELFRSLQPDVTHNIYVSILNDENAIISQPYEAKVDQLRYGEPREIDFTLLQDLDAVTVFLVYANGSQRSMKIFLQKDASVNRVIVQSEQFSQEVDLGESANYDLSLELFSGSDNTFALETVNLPQSINRYFTDSTGAARLSQVKFTESGRSKRASLKVSLPDRNAADVAMDKSIPFYVLVLPREKLKTMPDLTVRQWTEQELAALDVGYVKLELIPRGKGELLVRSPLLYYSILADESVVMSVDIVNEGSRRLDNTEIRADVPLGWTKTIDPISIAGIDIGAESRVNLTFVPPEDISPGKYEIRLRTTAMSNNQPVNALDKTVTIEVRPDSNVFGTILIILGLIGLVGGIVWYGIRLSRR